MTSIQIHHGNCLDILPALPDCSIDSIVTDPPYELGFMGKKWDNSGIAYNITLWQECLRVLKHGGHLLAFGGTRTYHRMAVAIEDAGFEIRDSLHWIYGSGFPKSLNLSKTLDKMAGAPVKVGKAFKVAGEYGDRDLRDPEKQGLDRDEMRHEAVTDAAKEWSGWGTALKPAHEPIVVARKPLVGTVAGNVLQYGTGAINIDGTRVGTEPMIREAGPAGIPSGTGNYVGNEKPRPFLERSEAAGRWPANIILTHNHDCTDTCTDGCPVRELDQQSGTSKSQERTGARTGKPAERYGAYPGQDNVTMGHSDSGGASRFFTVTEWDVPFRYVAKPGKRERNAGLDHLEAKSAGEMTDRQDGTAGLNSPRAGAGRTSGAQNHHPTVKPLALMRWLVRLVTPPNGTVLEPFAGSGTTLVACHLENLNAIGIEMTDEYLPIIEGRLAWAREQTEQQQLL